MGMGTWNLGTGGLREFGSRHIPNSSSCPTRGLGRKERKTLKWKAAPASDKLEIKASVGLPFWVDKNS